MEKADLTAGELKDPSIQSSIYGNLGNAWSKLGDFAHALNYYEKSLPLFNTLNDRENKAITLSNMSFACLKLGQIQAAEKYAEQSFLV